jgi:glycosyltransferase involved in cell wall biosynthesis
VKKTILFVHQSADLYGSDKVLLALVTKLDHDKWYPIVLLPVDGPLFVELEAIGAECHVVPISRLARTSLSLRGLFELPVNLMRSIRAFNRVLMGRHVDLVHSNTLAVLSGAIWARWHRIPHVWHVHEIILQPQIARKIYAALLCWFADCVVCNSYATKNNLLQVKPSLASKIQVVWNGLMREKEVDAEIVHCYRNQLGMQDKDILVALVGRINRLKGHGVLIEAAALLLQQGVHNLRFVIVGSAPIGQEHFLYTLKRSINESPARQCFVLQPFTPDVWSVLDACDIAVIPSTEPESFGMIALEAMASAKPVVASNHGGIVEVVVDRETGLLVPPGDAQALANAIMQLAADSHLRKKMGKAGQLRYLNEFKLDRYIDNMSKVYESMLIPLYICK